MRFLLPAVVLAALCLGGTAQTTVRRVVDDFGADDLSAWQTSMSPEYYRGGTGRKGLQVVQDPERGNVLRCDLAFLDAHGSEPVFITRKLDPQPMKPDVVSVSFWAKITEEAIAPKGGFKVRLRTGDASFTDYDVQEQLGRPFPVGEWVHVSLETGIGPTARNIWGKMFGTVRQMTFRLDDIDTKNTQFSLLLDDIELELRKGAAERTYEPRVHKRPADDDVRILLLRHRAEGYYGLAAAIEAAVPDATVDTFEYRGLHFEFFGFPGSLEEVLRYDAVFMLDVDPFMMPHDQCAWIADAVASGCHLVVFGGAVTLTHARDFKAPLRAVLPVTFESGSKDIALSVAPEPGAAHFLNQGFDPAGLGRVAVVQDLAAKEGAEIPWTAKGCPLVVTAPAGRGRSTVVNAWPHTGGSATGGFLTSTLSDDLMRRLVRYAIGRTDGPSVDSLVLPERSVAAGGKAQVRFTSAGAGEAELRLIQLDGAPATIRRQALGDYLLDLPETLWSEETLSFRIERRVGAEAVDYRDFGLTVLNSTKLEVFWARNKFTFAPGSPVAFRATASRRDIPDVQPGSTVTISYADGTLPVSVNGFVDVWVHDPESGTVIHDLHGAASVSTTAHGGLLPAWTVVGDAMASRGDGGPRFGEDGRVLACKRRIEVLEGGAVRVVTSYTFLHDTKVHRLPLLVALPVGTYAGAGYRVEQEGDATRAVFPTEMKAGKLFDGKGLKLTVDTPRGAVAIQVEDPSLRVWCRDLRQYDMTSFRLEVEAPYEGKEARAGESYEIAVVVSGPMGAGTPSAGPPAVSAAKPLVFEAWLEEPATATRWRVPAGDAGQDAGGFGAVLPNLASGSYELVVRGMVDERCVVQQRSPCYVVDPLDLTDLYPIMSIIGIQADGHRLDESGIRRRVDDLLAHGFNTAAITGTSSFKSDRPSHANVLKAYAESYAQQQGMVTTYEYSNFQHVGRKGVTKPCVFAPEYRESLKERLGWQIDGGNRTPRLMTGKVTDEPIAGPENMDYCEHCRSAFKQAYGTDLREPDPANDGVYDRWAFADFIGAYVSKGYAQGAALMKEQGATFDLLLTYMATGLGYQRPRTTQQDALDWSRYVKWVDFDVYPYFYPASQRIRMVQASFAMAYMRDVARARDIPWGFYMELDDRNWPYQRNPREATAECGFTAVAHGAGYLNSFIHRVVATGCQARPERWEAAGKALRIIRRAGPLLNRMPAVRAPVAVFYPNAQEAIANGYERPAYLLQALKGGFGDVDVHCEEVVLEHGQIPYQRLVLLGAEFVHAELVPILQDWLRKGGVLFCDSLPARTHRGDAIAWGYSKDNARPSAGSGGIPHTVLLTGRGRIVFVPSDLETVTEDLVEADDLEPEKFGEHRRALGVLLGHGLTPTIRVEYRETPQSLDLVEAGLRGNDDAVAFLVINHQPEPQEVVVRVSRPDVTWLVDLESMAPVAAAERDGREFAVNLTVPGRWCRTFAGYRVKPDRVLLTLAESRVARGGVLRYEASVVDAVGAAVKGGVLLEIEVVTEDGRSIARYGGPRAPLDGRSVVEVPVPLNASTGRHTLVVRAPQVGTETRAEFVIE